LNKEHAEHHFNLFKPTTKHAKANSKIIISMVAIWAVAVFGFQFLLKAVEKPTKEKSLIAFEQVWENVAAGAATRAETQMAAKSMLAVLGKSLKKEHRADLVSALDWSVYSLAPNVTKETAFEYLGLSSESLEAQLLAIELSDIRVQTIERSTKEAVPGIMSLYLTHNQSFLTDSKFLGFPFHYWYTSEFLLILFVLMCLCYCVLIGKINSKYKIEDI